MVKKISKLFFMIIFAILGLRCIQVPIDEVELKENQETVVDSTLPVNEIVYDLRNEEYHSIFELTTGNIQLEDSMYPDHRKCTILDWTNSEETLIFATDSMMFQRGMEYHIHFYFASDCVDQIVVRWGDSSGTFEEETFFLKNGETFVEIDYSHPLPNTYSGWVSVEAIRKEEINTGSILLSEFRLQCLNKTNYSVKVNQVGYSLEAQKTAIFQENCGEIFEVVNVQNGEVVYSGPILNSAYNSETGEVNSIGDFSSVRKAGIYRIQGAINSSSYDFIIENGIYKDLLESTLHMITLQRCGQKLTPQVALEFTHEACHNEPAQIYVSGESKDVTGGWHDAGDYGRYTLTSVKTINDLLLAGWLNPESFSDQQLSPDAGNGIIDVLDEALVGLNWLKKMQLDWGPVYTAAVSQSFARFVMPQQDQQTIYLLEEENTSTAAAAGSFALGALVFQNEKPDESMELLECAKKAYAVIDQSDQSPDKKNPWNFTAGDYLNASALDELYFASAALYSLTHESMYLAEVEKLIYDHPENLFGFTYSDMGGYGSFILLKDEEFKKTSSYSPLFEAMSNHIKSLLQAQYSNGYYIVTSGYYWGGNMVIANNAMSFMLFNEINENATLVHAAEEQIAYLLGKNSLNQSFITGYGTQYPTDIHHRMTESLHAQINGALVGGPDSTIESSLPIAKRYWDSSSEYTTNEVTIYYNSPLVYTISALVKFEK